MNDIKRFVPNLRFPTFLQDGGWKEQKFSSIFDFLPNNTLSRAELKEGKGDVYNIHYGDVLIKLNAYTDIQQENLPAIKNVGDIDKYLKARLQDGDIIVADTAEDETVGKCTEIVNVNETVVVSGLHTIPCRPKIKFAQAYLGYYMNSNAFHSRLLPIMQGVKVTSISKSALQNIDLTFSESLEEQQKIAECISSIDSYIFSINEKVEQLKAHKKSLMQKLFPQDGQTIPEYRFPVFFNEKHWSTKKLNEVVGNIVTGKLDANAMVPNGQYRFYTCAKSFFHIDRYAFDTEALLISGNGSNVGYIHYYNGKFNAYQRTYVLSDFKCNVFFLKYFLEYSLPERIKKEKKDGNTPYIVLSTLTEMPILLPELLEQKRISSCLLLIDKMIESNTSKANWLEQHKKGLMQQLFPTSK